MNYLVDADVLSEPTKPMPSSKVIAWLSANEGNLVVDSIIRQIFRSRPYQDGARGSRIAGWRAAISSMSRG